MMRLPVELLAGVATLFIFLSTSIYPAKEMFLKMKALYIKYWGIPAFKIYIECSCILGCGAV
jgi:hypothetical protein